MRKHRYRNLFSELVKLGVGRGPLLDLGLSKNLHINSSLVYLLKGQKLCPFYYNRGSYKTPRFGLILRPIRLETFESSEDDNALYFYVLSSCTDTPTTTTMTGSWTFVTSKVLLPEASPSHRPTPC